ncbi:right-handed parallel beta-helix repeat-containing protein [Patescibacteria group bacterium]|nr:right-handed parallel beta-helix repeat-containing protein [Patescibacteria group bacterium]MBU4458394.1 right-handed parallel beta-helix repeat-containing protein [Patescibacteria group bacterium]MCG2695851.1 right-handed parallel beta-helix repeat-containing protein [Candidatus Portnoybacteria bacterium]
MKKLFLAILIILLVSFWFIPSNVSAAIIIDGDLIKTSDNPDVYIVKLVDSLKYKRLILNPEIFNQYSHLKWENIKTVSQTELDEYTISDLVRAVGDEKVYKLYSNGDTGERRWIKTAEDFNGFGYKSNAIYEINSYEWNFYATGLDLAYQSPEAPKTPIIPIPPTRTENITIKVPADYATIQSALDASINGDTISVSKGTYKENIVISKNVKLIGESANYVTIDGQGNDSAIVINGASDFSIQRFIIKSQDQKAVYCVGNSKTKGVIKNIIFKDSKWGVYTENDCELVILNNIIYNNRALDNKDGGGIFIKDNLSYGITIEIRNNTIDDNHHGIWMDNSKVKTINNIVSSNMGSGISTGIYLKSGEINNSYSDIWGNGANSFGGVGFGDGGISLDPRFVSTRERNYRLIWGSGDVSPCIDVGSPNTSYNDGKLFTGTNYRSDMGAYGGSDNGGWE